MGSRTGKAEIGTLLWIDEQTEAGEVDPWKETADDAIEFADARPSATPTLGEYTAFLHGGIADRGKERYVRLRAWWAGNDPRRTSPEARPLDSCEVENLRAVIGLLDEGKAHKAQDQPFQEAGAYRESSDYLELFRFIRRCPPFAPYNCFLLHVQKPGAGYVAYRRHPPAIPPAVDTESLSVEVIPNTAGPMERELRVAPVDSGDSLRTREGP